MRHWTVFERAVMEPLIYLLHSVFCVLFLSIVCIENVCMLYSGSVMGARDGWFAQGSVLTYLKRLKRALASFS